jgi:hypothetical protein
MSRPKFKSPLLSVEQQAQALDQFDNYQQAVELAHAKTQFFDTASKERDQKSRGIGPHRQESLEGYINWFDGNYDPATGLYTFYRFVGPKEAGLVEATGTLSSRAVHYLGNGALHKAQIVAEAMANGKVPPEARKTYSTVLAANDAAHSQEPWYKDTFYQAERDAIVGVTQGQLTPALQKQAQIVSQRLAHIRDGTAPLHELLTYNWNDAGMDDVRAKAPLQDTLRFTTNPNLTLAINDLSYSHLITLTTTEPPLAQLEDTVTGSRTGRHGHSIDPLEAEWRGFGVIETGQGTPHMLTVEKINRP